VDVMHVSQTVAHANTDRRYRIAYLDGSMTGGVPVKLIQRLLPKTSIEDGRALFARLDDGR
jgi:hypothetical protein